MNKEKIKTRVGITLAVGITLIAIVGTAIRIIGDNNG